MWKPRRQGFLFDNIGRLAQCTSRDESVRKLGPLLSASASAVPLLRMLMKLRCAMGSRDENLVLAGHNEIDEAFFGGRMKNKNRENPLLALKSRF